MKKFYLLVLLSVVANLGYGQTAASYSFSAFSNTYTSISGTGTEALTVEADDATQTSISLGFNFTYCGTVYNSVSANSNGFLSLANCSASGYPTYINATSSFSSMCSGVGMLMPQWFDLYGASGTAAAYYTTTGVSPNRVFTFEYYNWREFNYSFFGATGVGSGNFQVKLYETSNIIDFCYGANNWTSTVQTPSSTIGIANSSSDYQTLPNSGTSPVPSSSTFTNTISTTPATNQVYRWTPCNLTVSPTSSTPVCSGSTLTLTGTVATGTATSYSWSGPGSYSSTNQNPTIVSIPTTGAGTYTFTATNASCSVSGTTVVVVNQTPTATISGTTNFCSGSLSFLTFTGTPGATVYYNINGGPTLSTVLGAGGTSGVSTGTLTTGTSPATYVYNLVSATLGSCSQSLSGSATITVNPNPSAITGTTAVCNGYSTTLSDPDAGGTWSGSTGVTVVGSGTSANVTGTADGSATVNYTFPLTGCTVSTSITINTTPVISGVTHLCEGSGNLLTATPNTGSWLSTNTAAATIDAGGNVTGVAAGITTISYTLPVTGCYAVTGDTVNPQPAPITGFNIVCEAGATTPLNDDSTSGVWSASNSHATVVASGGTVGTVTGVTAGSVTISYTIISASGSCSSLHPMTVNPIPPAVITPGGATTFCDGDSVVLTASAGASFLYQWNDSTGPIIGATNQTYTAYTSQGYQVVVLNTVTGCENTSPYTVVVNNPLPAAITGATEVCQLASITLSNTTPSGTWTASNSNATVTAGGGVVTGATYGAVTITYSLATGCNATYNITVDSIPQPITGTTSVCEAGSSTTLSDASGTGSWSASNGNATIDPVTGLVTGVTAGTDIISYTFPVTHCYVTATLTVNALPSPISGPTEVCKTFDITLSSLPATGTWTTHTGNASAGAGGIITGVSQGPDTVTYTLGTGCIQTYPITVNGLPAPIAGTLSVCEAGSTTTLTNDSTGTWSSSNPAKASIDPVTGEVTGVAAGSITITFTLSSTGCYVTAPFTVNPLPAAITGSSTVCAGSTDLLTSSPTPGTWSSDNNPVASVNATGLVTGHGEGIANITYTLGTGCQQSFAVTVNPLPAAIAGTTEVCAGLTTTLTDDSLGGTWSIAPASVASVNPSTGAVLGVGYGTANVTYTLPTGCKVTASVAVDSLPSAITGSTDVCYGSSTLFSDVTIPGTWTTENGSIATVNAGGSVFGAGVGTTNITYTLGTGCIATKPITVDALPAAIGGPTSVCIGTSITLTEGTTGGVWSSVNSGTATITSGGVVTGVTVDTVTIINRNPVTGCYVTTLITVNPLPSVITGTTTVCQFATTTLSDVSGTSTWTSQNPSTATVGASTGIVTGVAAGTTNITFALPTGCFVTTPVTVNATPTAITGTTTVCVGSTTSLGDTPAGGTWSILPLATATVSASGVVTGVAAGTATVDYTLGGCSQTATVTVNPVPGALITPLGDTTMCPGDFVVLTANTGAGLTYQWYSGATPIFGSTNSYYTATTGAFYKVKVTNGFSCTSTSSSMDVTVNPATAIATAGGPTTICATGSVTLNANLGAGLSYQWVRNGVGIPGATGSSLITDSAGNYTVVVSNTAGCSATSTPAITVNLLPTPSGTLTLSGATTFCSGDSVTITADPTPGLTYQWYYGVSPISGATNGVYTATASGTYSVAITNNQPCTNTPSLVVTTLALPSATITPGGPTIFCAGGSVPMSVPPGAVGTTYQWYIDSTVITGATNNTYTTTVGGNFGVQVISPAGCVNTTNPTLAVMEIMTPVIHPLTDTAFCWGGSAVLGLTVPAGTGAGFQWALDGLNIAGATNSTYSAGVPGAYTCTISVPGCSTTSYAANVVEHPLPNPVIFFDGVTISTQTYFTSYQWYRNMTAIGGANTYSILPTMSGSYEVQVTDTFGCQSVATAYPLSLSVTNVNKAAIRIYPNPAGAMVHIEADQPLNAVIYAIDGRNVLEQHNATDINVSSLASGAYTIMLYDQAGTMVKAEKLIKN